MQKIGVIGAYGRMGQAILEEIQAQHDILSAAVVEENCEALGQYASDAVRYSADLSEAMECSEVMIDFSLPSNTPHVVRAAQTFRKPLVCGVTGLDPATYDVMHEAAKVIPIFYATNMSMGIAVMTYAAQQMARIFGDSMDIEIQETHHNQKTDAPSGTALSLGEAILSAKGWPQDALCVNRSGPRSHKEVGITSLRGGNVAGEHTVHFLGTDETIFLTHRATSRRIFAQGAVRAAHWLVRQTPGIYAMADLIQE